MLKGLTLRGLEVFEALAAHGSVAAAAEATGLSQPSVSQQLSNLEKALGTTLIDRTKRPMRLTPAGRGVLARAETALRELRMARNELSVMDLSDLPALDIGLIDDFDNDLTPRLVTILADSLTKCRFKLITAPSLEISRAMTGGVFHIAISASTGEVLNGVVEYPLVRDPFIVVAPRGTVETRQAPLDDLNRLPFLRYARDQLIARQIETLMAREGYAFEERFEIGSHLALMAMVARRIGWAVTTPLGYMRAARFHDELEAYPLPVSDAARTISLFARADFTPSVPRDVAQSMRSLVQSHMIDPALEREPWLAGQLQIIDGSG